MNESVENKLIEYRFIDMDKRERVTEEEANRRGSFAGCMWRADMQRALEGGPCVTGFGYRQFSIEEMIAADILLPINSGEKDVSLD